MNKKLARTLTHIFGMTAKRDAMLGDLLYTLKSEETSAHAERLLMELAYCHHRSVEVARCLSAVVDFIETREGPSLAYNMAFRMAVAADSGPVAIMLGAKLEPLKQLADIEPQVKKQMARIIDRVRTKDLDRDMRLRPTLLCFDCVGPRRKEGLVLEPLDPYQFVSKLER